MKKGICLLLSIMLCASALVACEGTVQPGSQGGETPSSVVEVPGESGPAGAGTETPAAGASETEPAGAATETPGAPEEPAEDQPLDMEAFLKSFAAENKDKTAEQMCDAMLENPYFRMFTKQSTEWYYPALNCEFKPEGVKEAWCITDYITGSNAVVYVIVPEEGTDQEALGESFKKAIDPYYLEDGTLKTLSVVAEGKAFVAFYPEGMMPVNGPLAGKIRDFVEMFHAFVKENPEASPLEIVEYFSNHQKFTSFIPMAVEEGRLTGFGDFEKTVEIKGFEEGAVLSPMMMPNTNIAYVFKLAEGADMAAFVKMLEDNANLAWNVCVGADTKISEIDGQLVLFMMCSEGTNQ